MSDGIPSPHLHPDAVLPDVRMYQCVSCGRLFALPTTSPAVHWAQGLYWHRPCAEQAASWCGVGPKPGELRRLMPV
jgi:hypothetical protein